MKGAGLTQGAFYKQFASKEDLAAQASRRALESAFRRWSAAAAANPQDPLGAVIAFYLSMEHRAERMDGCPVVALGSDAARQGGDVKASFEAGIREYLEMLGRWVGEADGEEPSGKAMAILSTMVGAVLLSRAVNDERLSKRFLQAAAESVLTASLRTMPSRDRANDVDSAMGARSATVSTAELADWSGLELVARLADGSIPRPPMAETLPFTLLPPEEGKAGLLATPEPRFCSLTYTVHGGRIMTMLDTVMALAAQTTLLPGETCPSHETTAKFVRPIFADSGEMRVIGHVVSRGRTVITLEGRIEDAKGRLHAHGTSTCLIVSRKP